MENLVTSTQKKQTKGMNADWIIDARGARVDKIGRGQNCAHIFVALILLAAGYYCCDIALSSGIFSSGKGGTPSSPYEGYLLDAFDKLQDEPYDKLVDQQSETRKLEMSDPDLNYRLELKYKPMGVNLLLIQGAIVDPRSGKKLDMLETYRIKK